MPLPKKKKLSQSFNRSLPIAIGIIGPKIALEKLLLQ